MSERQGRKTVFRALHAVAGHVVINGRMEAIAQPFNDEGGVICGKDSDLLW